jgi:hypothetical protein
VRHGLDGHRGQDECACDEETPMEAHAVPHRKTTGGTNNIECSKQALNKTTATQQDRSDIELAGVDRSIQERMQREDEPHRQWQQRDESETTGETKATATRKPHQKWQVLTARAIGKASRKEPTMALGRWKHRECAGHRHSSETTSDNEDREKLGRPTIGVTARIGKVTNECQMDRW